MNNCLKLQAEVHCRINKCRNRGERNDQLCGHLIEAQSHRKTCLGDGQIPELVLDDDCHLVRKTFAQALGDVDPRCCSLERDVKVVDAGQCTAAGDDLAKHAADNRAQRFLHDLVIGDQTVLWSITHCVSKWRSSRLRSRVIDITPEGVFQVLRPTKVENRFPFSGEVPIGAPCAQLGSPARPMKQTLPSK